MIGTGGAGGGEGGNNFVNWGEIAGLGSDIDDGELCSSVDGDLADSCRGEMTGAGGGGFSLDVAVVLDEDETASSGAFGSAEWSIFDLEKIQIYSLIEIWTCIIIFERIRFSLDG